MNKEEIKAMIKDCIYSEDGITYMSDKQYNNYIDIIEELMKENKILRENAEHNDKVVDTVNWENLKLKEVFEKAVEYIKIYRSYQKINNKDYLKGRDEIGCLDICQVDELLDILKEVE